MSTRYFIHSRRRASEMAGKKVAIGLRELDAAEAEPHLRAKAKRERREAELATDCVKPERSRK